MCDATCFELLPDHYGQYIPWEFARRYAGQCDNVQQDDIDILLAGPEHPDYWDAWDDVVQIAQLRGIDGTRYYLYQDSNLYAIREGTDLPDYLIVV